MAAIIALADDLTGALEVGAKFAGAGIAAHVAIARVPPALSVIDTETRHLSPAEAARTIERLLGGGADADLVYLKTDSTLRGNIGAELAALMRLYPGSEVVYAPAYPAMGRTVRDGHLRVHGVPVHETSFARDALNPIRTSFVPDLIPWSGAIRLFDGETEEDIAAAAREILSSGNCRIAAGPAALAGHLAVQIALPRGAVAALPRIRKCLVVNGSRHDVSSRQIAYAEANGFSSFGWSIFAMPRHESLNPAEVANRNGLMVRDILKEDGFDALIVFGGDTAFGILDALGRPVLASVREVLPGIPLSRIDTHGLHVISKAGGFGEEDVLCRLKEVLHGNV